MPYIKRDLTNDKTKVAGKEISMALPSELRNDQILQAVLRTKVGALPLPLYQLSLWFFPAPPGLTNCPPT